MPIDFESLLDIKQRRGAQKVDLTVGYGHGVSVLTSAVSSWAPLSTVTLGWVSWVSFEHGDMELFDDPK